MPYLNHNLPTFTCFKSPEHKCGHFFKMDNGNFYCYPNNRIIWFDDAWVENRIQSNPGYLIDQTIYSVENKRQIQTDNSYIYGVKNAE